MLSKVLAEILSFAVHNGGEVHQIAHILSHGGCTLGLTPVKYVPLVMSHLVAAISTAKSRANPSHFVISKEILGLIFISFTHLAMVTFVLDTSWFVSVGCYLTLAVVLCVCDALTVLLAKLSPLYTTVVKVYQLYLNYNASSTGMLSGVSTTHILIVASYYLISRKFQSTTIKLILVSCVLTNGLQLIQYVIYRDNSEHLIKEHC